MLWIALATQLSAPLPTKIPLFTADDVPSYLIAKNNGVWLVSIRVTVNTDGSVQGCQTEKSSGIADLDNYTCRLVMRRGKFRPARLDDGTTVIGVFRTFVTWAVSDTPWDTSRISNPDLDILVQALPSGIRSPVLVHAMFAVDANGHMSGCAAEPTPKPKRGDNDPALVPIACDQLSKNFKPVPATDGAGKTILSVQDALVRFSTRGR